MTVTQGYLDLQQRRLEVHPQRTTSGSVKRIRYILVRTPISGWYTENDQGCLDQGGGGNAFCETKRIRGLVGDGGVNLFTSGKRDRDLGMDRAFAEGCHGAAEAITSGEANPWILGHHED